MRSDRKLYFESRASPPARGSSVFLIQTRFECHHYLRCFCILSEASTVRTKPGSTCQARVPAGRQHWQRKGGKTVLPKAKAPNSRPAGSVQHLPHTGSQSQAPLMFAASTQLCSPSQQGRVLASTFLFCNPKTRCPGLHWRSSLAPVS